MMNQKILMVATRMNSSKIKTAFAIFVALTFVLVCTSTTAYAKKKHKVKYGLVELTTTIVSVSEGLAVCQCVARFADGRTFCDKPCHDLVYTLGAFSRL